MGYQALLFCPDEKLARIVAQVFSELDFNVEATNEPFSAVKKLMAQRYDALVIDCESESNASLLFKGARNSSCNPGTLAIAMVEGQAGVAKAYRIGANLVLTKPINVEQAKGTLRVARGLLRKSADTPGAPGDVGTSPPAVAAAPTPASPVLLTPATTVAPGVSPVVPMSGTTPPAAPTEVAHERPEFEPGSPATAASAGGGEAAVAAVPAPEASAESAAIAETPAPAAAQAPKELAQPAAAPGAMAATLSTAAQAAAVAPAKVKAKEIQPATLGQAPEFEPVDQVHEAAPWHDSASAAHAPAFAALEGEDSRGTGGKKMLIGAVVLLAAAVLGYFGWTTLGQHKPASPAPASEPQPSELSPVAPMSRPATAAPAPAKDRAAATSALMPTAKVLADAGPEKPSDSLILHLESSSAQQTKVQDKAPIVVKPGKRVRVPAEEAATPEPSALAIASASENALSRVVATTGETPRQPTLATVKISQGVSQGLLIKKVNPIYPPSARSMRLEGMVLLEATIDREGRVLNPVVVKGDKVLARAALDAVRQWRYKPYYLDKQPVEIQTQITINFKLPN